MTGQISGPGKVWKSLSLNQKIVISAGSGVFVLLVIVVFVIALDNGGKGAGAGIGTAGGMPGGSAKATLVRQMKRSCTGRNERGKALCECVQIGFVGRLSESDARALLLGRQGGAKPPRALGLRAVLASFAATQECMKKYGPKSSQ